MTRAVDIIVIGGGIAGTGVAAILSESAGVVLLEAEDRPGYHSTGRSMAMFIESCGNETIRALSRAGKSYFDAPPLEDLKQDLLSNRGVLFVSHGDAHGMAELELLLASGSSVSEISPEDAVARVPILSRADVHRAVIDESGEDVDVDALHQAWLKRLRQLNGEIICGAPVTKLSQADGGWDVETEIQKYHTPIIVNAAGAWAGRSPYCRHLTGLTSLTGRCSVTPLRRGTPSLKPAS